MDTLFTVVQSWCGHGTRSQIHSGRLQSVTGHAVSVEVRADLISVNGYPLPATGGRRRAGGIPVPHVRRVSESERTVLR